MLDSQVGGWGSGCVIALAINLKKSKIAWEKEGKYWQLACEEAPLPVQMPLRMGKAEKTTTGGKQHERKHPQWWYLYQIELLCNILI